jgi:hypothetical protein
MIRLTRRDSAEWYMLLTLLSFAGSVSITRLFLSLSGYPQIGGGELHIAHVLWGGLLLYAGALLPLIFANRGVYASGAILAGIGVGLFIDEVGKFITASNNYFFPVAAPIIYVFFLLSIILLLHIRRAGYAPKNEKLSRALDEIRESLHEAPTEDELIQIKTDLQGVLDAPPSAHHAQLAQALLTFVEKNPPPLSTRRRFRLHTPKKVVAWVNKLLPDWRLRLLLILGLIGIGALMWKNPLCLLIGPVIPAQASMILCAHAGRQTDALSAVGFYELRLGLEVAVGLTLLLSAFLLLSRREGKGILFGIAGLLVSLTTVDLLLFYFEQFSTIITVTIQFLLLLGLYLYRDRRGA